MWHGGTIPYGFRKQTDKEISEKLHIHQDLQSNVCSNEVTWHAVKSVGAEERNPVFWNRMKLTRWSLRALPLL